MHKLLMVVVCIPFVLNGMERKSFEDCQILDLRGKKTITTLAEETDSPEQIKVLYLFDCGLKKIPSDIGQFKALRELYAHTNQLEEWPKELEALQKLEMLSLAYNKFKDIPVINGLRSLTTLDLQGNVLTDISNLCVLKKLQILNVSFNKIPTLSRAITLFADLKILYLTGNELTKLPDEITLLNTLGMLLLAYNKLSVLPVYIGNLASLTVLELNHNPLALGEIERLNLVLPKREIKYV